MGVGWDGGCFCCFLFVCLLFVCLVGEETRLTLFRCESNAVAYLVKSILFCFYMG